MADAAEKLTFKDTFQTYVARYPPTEETTMRLGTRREAGG